MPIPDILQQTSVAMKKAVDHFEQELKKVRTGRASASLLDDIRVDYYGSPAPLGQVASVNVPDARTIVIQPWEKNLLGAIEKAIRQSDLGLNPNNDGAIIRVPIPPLTEERRRDIVKMCKKEAEESRVAVRNSRRDQIETLKKAEKEEHFSEDDRKRAEDDVQKLTDKHIKMVDDLLAKKEKEVMEV